MRIALLIALAVLALAVPALVHAGDDCLGCHGTAKDVGDPKLVVDADAWKHTVHGDAGVDCVSCHVGHDEFPHEKSDPLETCNNCHAEEVEKLAASAHGAAAQGGGERPGCLACHGAIHALRPADDETSPIHPKRLAATCGRCHADPAFMVGTGIKRAQPLAAYAESVHARSVQAGGHAATCGSCHGSHDIRSPDDPRSRVNRKNVPDTCGQCHAAVARAFAASVHGQAAARGIREAPVCTDCHGEHRILGPGDKDSPVFVSNVPKMACERCHADVRLTEKFGLKSTAVAAFESSFHGLAGRAGNASVANCASCHGVHDILPSSDPRSHVHPANLPATCGVCHPGAGTTFAIGAVHVLPAERERTHPAVYWIRIAYLWLIAIVIGAMTTHNLLDLRRKAISGLVRPVVPAYARRQRMGLWFRIAHGLLLASFLVLVWSGFALTYPEAWWARPLVAWEEHWRFRGILHRLAAVVLLGSFGLHAVHLALDRRARACVRAMMPGRQDLTELRERLRWFIGRRADLPRSPAVGYVEKLEYLAVAWGIGIMALSGFVLWFETWSLTHLPKWMLDVATVVHFYEALLATLAILVWHLYFVIFDPLVYPMDTAWLTGREAAGRTLERTASTVEPDTEAVPPAPS
ncbi:MAG TPA: cytochrome c3 family protein [Candidatus Binatia bacterium]